MKLDANFLFILIILAVAGAGIYYKIHGNVTIATRTASDGTIYEIPRTATPVGDYTRGFAQKGFAFKEDGKKRVMTYYWFEPAGKPYPQGKKFPLVVVLHGAPGNAYAAEFLFDRDVQAAHPSFILVPMAPMGQVWSVPDQLDGKEVAPAFRNNQALPDVIRMLTLLVQNHPVDLSRIYVVGCSDGGSGAYGAALHYPEIFAASVPMSGMWNNLDAPKMTRIPLWIFHGARDPLMPVANARSMATYIKKAGGNAQYTEFPDMGHECSSPLLYTPALWQWLFSQKKG